jgi:hypothetical protein
MPKNIRILCEGISDLESLKEIFKKENLRIKIIQFNSRSRLLKKVNQYIFNYYGMVDIFIILVDSHCTDPSNTYTEVNNHIEFENKDKVRIHIIKHSLETWFLVEENAIKSRFRINFRSIPNPESICKPDETLNTIIRKSGTIQYRKSIHAKAISAMLNTEDLKNKSENFRSFIELIINTQSDE